VDPLCLGCSLILPFSLGPLFSDPVVLKFSRPLGGCVCATSFAVKLQLRNYLDFVMICNCKSQLRYLGLCSCPRCRHSDSSEIFVRAHMYLQRGFVWRRASRPWRPKRFYQNRPDRHSGERDLAQPACPCTCRTRNHRALRKHVRAGPWAHAVRPWSRRNAPSHLRDHGRLDVAARGTFRGGRLGFPSSEDVTLRLSLRPGPPCR